MKLLDHQVILPTWGTPWALTPLGCWHVDQDDGDGCDQDLLQEHLDRIRTEPLHYWVGLGDYFSLARTHYRDYLAAYRGDPDSRAPLDKWAREECRRFYHKWLKPVESRCWGLAEGNHTWEFPDGTTSTQYLCQLANVPYLEKGSVHRIAIHHRNYLQGDRSGGTVTLKMLVHHGDWSGGASTTGGDLNAAENRGSAWDVDIVVFAHTHRKHGWTVPVLTIPSKGALDLVERPRVFIRAGAFQKGYSTKCITYPERKLMKPTSLGAVTLRVGFKQEYDAARYAARRAAQPDKKRLAGTSSNYKIRYRLEQ